MHILEELLHPIPFEIFSKSHLFRTPYAAPFKAKGFQNFISWPLLEQILEKHNDAWLPQGGLLPSDPQISSGKLTPEQAVQGFQQGRTVLVRHAERAHAAVQAIAKDFENLFAKPVDVQLYVTPSGAEGFNWHYDVEEVFVIQCRGEKEFRLRENTIDPWPLPNTLPKDMHFEREKFSAETVCTLKAGDWLYIPSGCKEGNSRCRASRT